MYRRTFNRRLKQKRHVKNKQKFNLLKKYNEYL